ncbi:MAG: ABC transporter permease, partial [Alphaproteobacteria bacterium]
RITFAMMIMLPVMQTLLLGYAINTDPRHMPMVVELRDDGPFVRDIISGLVNSSYFNVTATTKDPAEADAMLRSGQANFLLIVPDHFEEKLIRGERPELLFAADASDPVAAGGPVGAVATVVQRALAHDLTGPLAKLAPTLAPYDIVVHRRYNPAGITAYNIVPGLLGIILTMTLVMITAIAITREAERGTLETLLSTPVKPYEVMIGKTVPYIFVAAIQISLVLAAARLLFDVPFTGSAIALSIGLLLFVCANLLLGFLISTAVRTQMQAMQMTFMIFLPSMLLSGFLFPFAAMPTWAQAIGECVPITHFIRIVRKVMLKGAGLGDIAGDLWPLLVILAVIAGLALIRYRRTLD